MPTFSSFLPEQIMNQGETQKRAQRKAIEETLAQHKLAVEGVRKSPEGCVAEVADTISIDEFATSSPKKRTPPTKDRYYKHLSVEKKEQIRASIINGSSYRNPSKIFGISLGSISKIMHSTAEELSPKTHSGGRRESIVKVTPKIVSDISAFVFAHPQATQREMRDEIVRTSSKMLS